MNTAKLTMLITMKAIAKPTAHQPSRVLGRFKKGELELAIFRPPFVEHGEKSFGEAQHLLLNLFCRWPYCIVNKHGCQAIFFQKSLATMLIILYINIICFIMQEIYKTEYCYAKRIQNVSTAKGFN